MANDVAGTESLIMKRLLMKYEWYSAIGLDEESRERSPATEPKAALIVLLHLSLMFVGSDSHLLG